MNINFKQKIDRFKGRIGFIYYTRVFTPVKAFLIRRKKQINVIFAITELGVWKTEELYLQMKKHPRFNPVLRVLPTWENRQAQGEVTAYLVEKGYEYEVVCPDEPLQKDFKADIIFYQKPYLWVYAPLHTFLHNKNALFCYVSYGYHNIVNDYICNQPLHNYAWQYYFENEACAQETALVMANKGKNIKITGVPMTDAFLLPLSSYKNKWKQQSADKKKIIWAPHFSFASDVFNYSTFLRYADFMLEIAQKYVSQVQFLFKPHPLLMPHLYDFWGKEKTDAYYAQWLSMENTQMELGQYVDFFMTSDAMIHDCGSFTNEYIYTHNPVMYLNREGTDSHDSNLNSFAKQAYHLHYMGNNEQDIEDFIVNVINGQDEMAAERQAYYDKYLLPHNGQTACQNIIDAIWGE